MKFKKIIANINYSPNMVFLLSEYNRQNAKKIKQTKWAVIFLSLFILNLSLLSLIDHSQNKINRNYNLNLSSTENSLNHKIIKNILSYDENDVKFLKKIGIEEIKSIKLINNLKTKNNYYEISLNNLDKKHKILYINNYMLFAKKALPNYYGKIIKIDSKNNFIYILSNGNIIVNNYNVVKNKRLDLINYLSANINVDKNTIDENGSFDFIIKINKKTDWPAQNLNKKINTLTINLDDVLEYSNLTYGPEMNHNSFDIDLSKLENEQSIEIPLSFKIKTNYSNKKINSNIPTSYDCKMELAVLNDRVSLPINCKLEKQMRMFLKSKTIVDKTFLTNLIYWALIISIVSLIIKICLLVRLFIIKKEIKTIRQNINKGIL